jgi:hypothetical protein
MTLENVTRFEDFLKMKLEPRNDGMWQLDSEALVLTLYHPGCPRYEVSLQRCRSSAMVLDWIAQVAAKSWVTAEIFGELVFALNDYLRLQRNYCSCGEELRLRTGDEIIEVVDKNLARFAVA